MKQNGMIIKRLVCMAAVCALGWFASGCASGGEGQMKGGGTGTQVDLNKNNYKLLKAGAKGESTGFKLLGILPFANPNYADAKASLYESVGVPLTGKSVALANQTEDRSTLYLILFSLPKITITADVVEFVPSNSGN